MALRHPSLTCIRQVSSFVRRIAKSTATKLHNDHSNVPIYPYEPARFYKQSNWGLYGGARIQFGNTVSERSKIKTRRKWKPNIQTKRLWSASLEKWLRIRVSSRALRTIDKVGGLDEYLLGEKPARVKELGFGGWLLRWRILQTDAVEERYRLERKRLGLPDVGTKVGNDGTVVGEEELQDQIKRYDHDLEESEGVIRQHD